MQIWVYLSIIWDTLAGVARFDEQSEASGTMYYAYILKSKVADKTYTGHTDNIERRLKEHNLGLSYFSKRHKPWEIIHFETYETLGEAITREKYFKTSTGRRWMKKVLFK